MPQDVKTDRNSRGALFYIHKEGNSKEKAYPRDEVFHLRGFTMDGLHSDPVLVRARHAIGLSLATQEYASRFFSQDATPGIVIERTLGAPSLTPDNVLAIKAAWKLWHQGVGMSHEPAVLAESGSTVRELTRDHQKLQFIEARKFQVIEVCRVLRLSPHKLADLDHGSYSNIEELNRSHLTHTLRPCIRRWRQAVYRCLLTVNEQLADSVYAEHDVDAFQQGSFETQSEGFRKLLEKGVYSINEVRRLMNLNPVDGGDEHFIQLNMGTIQDVANGITLPAKDGILPVKRPALAQSVRNTQEEQ
jgi:HK97 family phage portal protein